MLNILLDRSQFHHKRFEDFAREYFKHLSTYQYCIRNDRHSQQIKTGGSVMTDVKNVKITNVTKYSDHVIDICQQALL